MTELCLDEELDVDMGRYTGIVWVIIVNNHHTQEFLSQLTLVIKKIPGSDWERIRDFFHIKKEAPVLEVSPLLYDTPHSLHKKKLRQSHTRLSVFYLYSSGSLPMNLSPFL